MARNLYFVTCVVLEYLLFVVLAIFDGELIAVGSVREIWLSVINLTRPCHPFLIAVSTFLKRTLAVTISAVNELTPMFVGVTPLLNRF